MIDTMLAFDNEIDKSQILNEFEIQKKEYILMTMHRPATVDNKEGLIKLLSLLKLFQGDKNIVFPIHPRTKKNIINF